MSELLVEDGSTYPVSVTVPEDGDARNAASVVVGFQALADRCKYLYTKLGVWLFGGTLTPADNVILDTSQGAITVIGNDDNYFSFGSGSSLQVNGRVREHLFTAGVNGRANKKPIVNNTALAGSTTLADPRYYDFVFINPGGDCTYQIDPASVGNLVVGDHITFQTIGGGGLVTILDGVGASLGTIKSATGFFSSVELVWTGATFGWRGIRVPHSA